jgi:hypothetical protein
MDDVASSSIRKFSEAPSWCSTICTIVSNKKQAKILKPSPLPGTPNAGEEISSRVAECTHPKS